MAKKAVRKPSAKKAAGMMTTLMVGEEHPPTTLALGEEIHPTTLALGEEGPTIFMGEHPTTLALGEEHPTLYYGEHPPSNPLIEHPSNVIAEQFGGIIDPGGPVEQKVKAAPKATARKRKRKK
jgi:hypothetical protein